MRRLTILVIAAMLALPDVTVFGKGGSGGHSGPSHSKPKTSPKKNKNKNRNKKKKKKKKKASKRRKSNKKASKRAKRDKKAKKNRKRKDKVVKDKKKPKKNRKRKDKVVKDKKKPKKDSKRKDKVVKDKKKPKKNGKRKSKFVKNPKLSKSRERKLRVKIKENRKKRFHKVKKTGRTGRALTAAQKRDMESVADNPNLPEKARDGATAAADGTGMTPGEAKALERFTDPELARRAGLSDAEREAIKEALEVDPDLQAPWLKRLLRVVNETQEQLTIWVHYRTVKETSTKSFWQWMPGPPVNENRALKFTLDAGRAIQVEDDEDVPIEANKVRIWAQSESGAALEKHKNKDLWLVQPGHKYFAKKIEEKSYSFKGKGQRQKGAEE